MKKIFTLITAMTCTLVMMATDYTGELTVNAAGNESQQEATISVEEKDGSVTLNVRNFVFEQGSTRTGVGNIILSDLTPSEQYGITTVGGTQQRATITKGDDPTITTWLGTLLGSVPVDIVAKYNAQVLHVDLNLSVLGQGISVSFVGTVKQGDINADGTVNVSDVTSLVNIILGE